MQVVGTDADLAEIVGQVLGHLLGQRGDECALATLGAGLDLADEIVDLAVGTAHLHIGIEQSGGADELLDNLGGVVALVVSGRGGDEHDLVDVALELVDVERPVVDRRGQAEAEVDQCLLARGVAAVHAAHLGNGHVRLVDEEQPVLGEVIEQGPGRGAGGSTGEVAGVVFDAGAVAGLTQGFEVVAGAFFESGGFEDAVLSAEFFQTLGQLGLDVFNRGRHAIVRGDEVLGRVDVDPVALGQNLAGQRIEFDDALDLVVPELDANGEVFVGGMDGQGVAADAELTARERELVALVLLIDQSTQNQVS